VQNISVGKFPSYMKFRLSLNDTELHNVDKFMVESKIKLENSACSNNCAKDITGMIMPKKKSNRSTTTEFQSTSKSDMETKQYSKLVSNNKALMEAGNNITTSNENGLGTETCSAQVEMFQTKVTHLRPNSAPAKLSKTQTNKRDAVIPRCTQSSSHLSKMSEQVGDSKEEKE
jgi:hypothetical protein